MSRQLKLVGGVTAIFLCACVFASSVSSQEPEGNFGVGNPDVFLPKYLAYRNAQLASPNPDVMRVPIGYVKGLSTNFTKMTGEMAVNLQTGTYTTTLSGLTPLTTYAVWLVDGSESSLIPPPPDLVSRLTTFLALGPTALLSGNLGLLGLPFGLTIDRVIVTPSILFGGEQQGAGTVNVFQKIFFRRLSLENAGTGTVLFTETTPPPNYFALVPDLAAETDELPPFAAVRRLSDAGACQILFAAAQRVGRIRQARQADLARRGSVLQRNVQRKRPDLRHVPPFGQQLHDRSAVHRQTPPPTIRCSSRSSIRRWRSSNARP